MKIEEAKIRFEEIETYTHGFYDDVLIKKRDAKVLLDQIEPDQPKLVVPKFVADWYEEHKDKLEEELCYQIWLIRESGAETDFEYWLTETENPIQTLINMHQFGYTVKLYTVEIPNPNGCNLYLIKVADKEVTITSDILADVFPDNLKLTEAEIRKDYDWAWQFREEVTE